MEQSHGRYCGLPGSDGAARDLLQKVEQSRGRYCGLPGGPGLGWSPIPAEARMGIIRRGVSAKAARDRNLK